MKFSGTREENDVVFLFPPNIGRIFMTDKLTLYNDALLMLGERRLASLTEAREPRRALDDVYDTILRYCLEQGYWNFAIRAAQIDASPSVVPAFGYCFAFAKPADFVRVVEQAGNETFTPPFTGREIVDEPGYWYANVTPIFVRYVSDHFAYGRDLSLWPESFCNFVATRLANKICRRITGNEPSDKMERNEKRAKADALSKDAMNEPVGFTAYGTWVRARLAGVAASRWDKSA